jgi:hypothetical protein
MTPPNAPAAPPNVGASVAPKTPVKVQERMARPLEARFPRLYNDFETVNTKGKVEDVMVPKKVPPTLHDVIAAVCQAHGSNDQGLVGDLGSSVTDFLGLKPVGAAAPIPGTPANAPAAPPNAVTR